MLLTALILVNINFTYIWCKVSEELLPSWSVGQWVGRSQRSIFGGNLSEFCPTTASLEIHPLGPMEQQQIENVGLDGFLPDMGRKGLSCGDGPFVGSHSLLLVGKNLVDLFDQFGWFGWFYRIY